MLLKITKTKQLRMIDSRVSSLRSQWTSIIFIGVSDYSRLSNKRDVTLTDFEKFQPPQKKIHPPRLLIP